MLEDGCHVSGGGSALIYGHGSAVTLDGCRGFSQILIPAFFVGGLMGGRRRTSGLPRNLADLFCEFFFALCVQLLDLVLEPSDVALNGHALLELPDLGIFAGELVLKVQFLPLELLLNLLYFLQGSFVVFLEILDQGRLQF